MASRPVFLHGASGVAPVRRITVEFAWSPGLAVSQKQKNVRSLHAAAHTSLGGVRLLEISTKSEQPAGVALSAFRLALTGSGTTSSVENHFQAAKRFADGGPFVDLLHISPADAKRDARLCQSGRLVGFEKDGHDWPLTPTTAFYDWLYLQALRQHPALAEQLCAYDGFTDIEFNPAKSLNCQAAAAALYVALRNRNLLDIALASPQSFIRCCQGSTASAANQTSQTDIAPNEYRQ